MFFLCLISTHLLGFDVRCCYVTDAAKHQANQQILKTMIEEELSTIDSNMTTADQVHYLITKVPKIAGSLLKKGFFLDAYGVPVIDEHSIVSFNRFTLWEGEKNSRESLPVTFFAYAWPSEEFAIHYHPPGPLNAKYSSAIHSHPIFCSFSVLEGTLFQKNYELVLSHPMKRTVSLSSEEIFQEGAGSVDYLDQPFIHQLCARGTGSKPTISLHAYGRSSAEKVVQTFQETRSVHFYHHVLQKDGVVQVNP
jgi:hypothetical protein